MLVYSINIMQPVLRKVVLSTVKCLDAKQKMIIQQIEIITIL